MDDNPHLARLMLKWSPTELAGPVRHRVQTENRRFATDVGRYLSAQVERGHIPPRTPAVYAALLMGPLLEDSRTACTVGQQETRNRPPAS
jgi:hypothetical protein